jgi:hypothetical protein
VLHRRGWLLRLRALTRPLPDRLREPVKLLVADPIPSPVVPPSLEQELRAFFREDAERLRAYTGQGFERWSI